MLDDHPSRPSFSPDRKQALFLTWGFVLGEKIEQKGFSTTIRTFVKTVVCERVSVIGRSLIERKKKAPATIDKELQGVEITHLM
mmetsp:Transcript_3663/g.4170  ORF Transcript_3663/g.4170 Transcript_3663/m.4170 type:complete len:84 (+) Transcript_3663:800-1051(+)